MNKLLDLIDRWRTGASIGGPAMHQCAQELEQALAFVECPVCGVKANEADEIAADCGQEYEPSAVELAGAPDIMRRVGESLIKRANEAAGPSQPEKERT